MTNSLALDSSPLSLLAHPNPNIPVVLEINIWLADRLSGGAAVYLPEITDYEVRRELLRAGKHKSVRKLDALRDTLLYLPLDTATMRRAAEMWAQLRNQGPATADGKAIDADVILAAQAEQVGAMVVTENVGHLARLVTARHWRDIPTP